MTSQRDQGPEDPFAQAWKNWLERPLRKQAPEAAAHLSALLRRRAQAHRLRWIPLAAAAALTCVLGVSMFRVFHQAPPPQRATESRQASALGKGEVLIWLDDRTPLYMTFQPPDVQDSLGVKR